MTVNFECITRTSVPAAELFDRARNIDAHKDSTARSREEAVGGGAVDPLPGQVD
ncbi:hypothetical protein QMA10_04870 [Arthrobacter sp. APC 3897]|uniref:hypothetical protein n=1 Tax=Arthrobacter sp. APC 3897 TaxID=3035204 RepID=UPI0025B5FE8F|nr:hypothetical protein [Arthrobacter sp. APC 3897]MDN3481255.1 hypothetical protein [Arthrobacter sp. APC 3897]